MRTLKIKYPTITKTRTFNDKVFVMEVIRDLDEAIDLICEAMGPDGQEDPFAEDLCPYFGVLWPAAEALSSYLTDNSYLVKNKSVLELGCGLGLPSMVASNLGGKVLATDFHPDVEEYFVRNTRHSSVSCRYQRLNWRENGLSESFDVVIGSDVLYESKHPHEVAEGLIRFVNSGGKIILADPGRNYLSVFLKAMAQKGHEPKKTLLNVFEQEVTILEFSL